MKPPYLLYGILVIAFTFFVINLVDLRLKQKWWHQYYALPLYAYCEYSHLKNGELYYSCVDDL